AQRTHSFPSARRSLALPRDLARVTTAHPTRDKRVKAISRASSSGKCRREIIIACSRSATMRQKSVLAWVEWLLAIALTLVGITLHLRLLRHAGPLWRDEISSLNLATATNFSEFWRRILPDNFPALFFILLRG